MRRRRHSQHSGAGGGLFNVYLMHTGVSCRRSGSAAGLWGAFGPVIVPLKGWERCRNAGSPEGHLSVTSQAAGPGGALVLRLQHFLILPEPGTGSRVSASFISVPLASPSPSPSCALCISAFKGTFKEIYNFPLTLVELSILFREEMTQAEGRTGKPGY